MQYLENELKDLMENLSKPLTISQIKSLVKQLLEGLNFLHSRFIIHRDLKTSNLLYGNDGYLRICDFGLARPFASRGRPYTQEVVTLWYRAPELILGQEKYTEAIDIWSVGCIFAEIILGEALFKGKSELEQLDLIFKSLGVPSDHIWPEFSSLMAGKGLSKTYTRPTNNKLAECFSKINTGPQGTVLNHNGFDLMSKMLDYNPRLRLTAKEALNHSWFKEAPLPCQPSDMPKFESLNTMSREERKAEERNNKV